MALTKVAGEIKVDMETDQALLIRGSDYEQLIEKFRREREYISTSELNQKRFRDIIKSIASVYYFLRCAHGIGHRDLTLEEFEIGEAYLKRVAEQKVKKPIRRFLRKLGIIDSWGYYLLNNYFRVYFNPPIPYPNEFETRWYSSHPWFSYSYNTFDGKLVGDYLFFAIPPNIRSLAHEIIKKRYGVSV